MIYKRDDIINYKKYNLLLIMVEDQNNISVKIIKQCIDSDIKEVDEILKNDNDDQTIKKINL